LSLNTLLLPLSAGALFLDESGGAVVQHPQCKWLRISDFTNLEQLAERLLALVAAWNAHAHPFNWSTKSAAQVMAPCEARTQRAFV